MQLKEMSPSETQNLDTLKQRTGQTRCLCIKEHMWMEEYLFQRKYFHFRELDMIFGRGGVMALQNVVWLASENLLLE